MNRLIRDESGMVMAIAIMMIVIIGVMGAGLLAFVTRDLESVITVNQGQKALELADAGAQAAKQQLRADPDRLHYDSDAANNAAWAYVVPSGQPGVTRTLSGGTTRVTIQTLQNSTTDSELTDPNYAPELFNVLAPKDYYRVVSSATVGNVRRKVEAIYLSSQAQFPKAYFATMDINIGSQSTRINNVSIFAGRDINGLYLNNLQGEDIAYGNWQNAYNDKARPGNGVTPMPAGAAAERSITYSPASENVTQKDPPSSPTDRFRKLDFDNSSSTVPGYKFCRKGVTKNPDGTFCWPSGSPQPANVITYPFEANTREVNLDLLKELAVQQGHYFSIDTSVTTSHTIDDTKYPASASSKQTIYYVECKGSARCNVDYSASGTREGTIVIINGDLKTSASSTGFTGVIIMRDPNNFAATATPLQYNNQGDFTFTGYLNIEGTATIKGSANPILTQDVLRRPGFFDVTLWSWRELYQ
jgi:hypothetical protein